MFLFRLIKYLWTMPYSVGVKDGLSTSWLGFTCFCAVRPDGYVSAFSDPAGADSLPWPAHVVLLLPLCGVPQLVSVVLPYSLSRSCSPALVLTTVVVLVLKCNVTRYAICYSVWCVVMACDVMPDRV